MADHLFSGIYPVLYALFDRNGALDRAAMADQVEACLDFGADGIAVLGLATEVRALTAEERRLAVEWTAAALGRRKPLAVTIFAPTPEAQLEAVRHAAGSGADWVILQPPASARSEDELIDGFERVLEGCPLPAAIQNAPQFIGLGLAPEPIAELARRRPALRLIKQEVSAVETAELAERVGRMLTIFSGRGGIELLDGRDAGAAGHIPAPDYADILVRIWRLAEAGDERAARELYARVLPLATFVLQSIDSLLTYGKLLFCRRYGLPYHQRQAHLAPTGFGVRALAAHAAFAGIDVRLDAPADGAARP